MAFVKAFVSESYFRENRGLSDLNPTSPIDPPSLPPLPRLTLRVAVTGHRPDRLASTESIAIRHQVEAVLRQVKESVVDAHENLRSIYQGDSPVLRVISMLAEGSDRIVAQTALDLGYELQAILPFNRGAYEEDFATEASRVEFQSLLSRASTVLELDGVRSVDSSSGEAGQSYESCGRMILDHCDILIAIWNGGEGRKGGTAEIVREADRRGTTIIWIDGRAPHGIRFGINAATLTPSSSEVLSRLSSRVAELVAPPEPVLIDGHAREYFREKVGRWSPAFIWKAFLFIVRGSSPPSSGRNLMNEPQSTRALDLGESNETSVKSILEPAYLCADALANRYASTYRSAFLLNYLMAATAVFFAFVGYVSETSREGSFLSRTWLSLSATVIEFALIGAILIFKLLGTRSRWHERWIDYRLLAEQLRQQMLLAHLGRILPRRFVSRRSLSGNDPANSWVQWLVEAYTRSAGIIGARFTADYLIRISELLAAALRLQLRYHAENAERLRKVDRALHRIGAVLFSTAAFACSIHLLNFLAEFFDLHLFAHGGRTSVLLTLVTVVGPAFGAAVMAIRFQGEFERSIRRSRAIGMQLEAITKELEHRTIGGGDISSRTLAEMAISGAELMVVDVLDWRTVLLARPLLLPS